MVAFAHTLHTLLRDRLVAVYLGGSFSTGDYVEGSSDLDVLVVTADELSREDLTAFAALHERLLTQHEEAAHLEGDYVPRGWIRPEGTSRPTPFFRNGRLEPRAAFMLSADNIANMRLHGISVFGPDAAALLPEVSPGQVRDAVRAMLREEAEALTESQAAEEILDLVRSYRALETGEPTSRAEGLRWGLARLDQRWHPLLQHADAVRRGATVPPDDDTLRRGLAELRASLER